MSVSKVEDPFKQQREIDGTATIEDQNDPVTMVLGLKDVRKCAHNWKVFQSGGEEVGRIFLGREVGSTLTLIERRKVNAHAAC